VQHDYTHAKEEKTSRSEELDTKTRTDVLASSSQQGCEVVVKHQRHGCHGLEAHPSSKLALLSSTKHICNFAQSLLATATFELCQSPVYWHSLCMYRSAAKPKTSQQAKGRKKFYNGQIPNEVLLMNY